MKQHKVVMIGLDACDPALAQRFAADGIMPNLARLMGTAARAPVELAYGLFVGCVWVNFGTALRPDRHGFYCWDKIDVETYEYKGNPPNLAHLPQFWASLSDAGRRVASIDAPHMIANRPLNGVQVVEWGCHDRHHGLHTWPPEFVKRIEAEFGLHDALQGDDAFAPRDFAPDDEVHKAGAWRDHDEDCALLRDMLAGAAKKRRMITTILDQEPWDLFLGVFGESHSIGHQQWHLHDPRHPRYSAATVEAMGGDPLAQVYAELDRGLGEVEAQLGPDTLFMVYLSHGIGPHYDGTHLLDEALTRLDRWEDPPEAGAAGQPVAPPAKKLQPNPVLAALAWTARRLKVPAGLRSRLGEKLHGALVSDTDSRAIRRYFREPNNTVYGGVRLNLVGREPKGRVRPEEVDALVENLTRDLLELVNAETGKPVIRSVERCDRWHRRTPTDTMPDLFLDWDRSAPINAIASPKIGVVDKPIEECRTGDHRPAGMLLVRGGGLPGGVRMPALAVEDIGPSIAARLGVKLKDVDGVVCPWLAGVEGVAGGDPAPAMQEA
jgi:predicted AlkP superfamily phosphohydrolase/phosphomutase